MSEDPQGRASERSGALGGQRLLLGLALATIAAVLAAAAQMERSPTVEPTTRIGARMELTELIAQERARAESLQAQAEDLAARVAEYEAALVADSDELARLQAQVEEVAVLGGLVDVRGPGLTVTLEDSTRSFDGTSDPNNLVIHQQDLRAVVNALWTGGAEAISINDSRVLSTSGIYCVGNTLYLNGRHYAPPFVIRAIGSPEDMAAALDRDEPVQRFADHAAEYDFRFDIDESDELLVAAYSGSVGLELAVPAARGG